MYVLVYEDDGAVHIDSAGGLLLWIVHRSLMLHGNPDFGLLSKQFLKGCEDLIPAGSIYIADASPELKCGPSWTLKQISERKELTDALKKDCEILGLPYLGFIMNLQYDPGTKLNDLIPDTDKLKNFNEACEKLVEE